VPFSKTECEDLLRILRNTTSKFNCLLTTDFILFLMFPQSTQMRAPYQGRYFWRGFFEKSVSVVQLNFTSVLLIDMHITYSQLPRRRILWTAHNKTITGFASIKGSFRLPRVVRAPTVCSDRYSMDNQYLFLHNSLDIFSACQVLQ
jgi:hypothetical protein